jgi:hypothetical protein
MITQHLKLAFRASIRGSPTYCTQEADEGISNSSELDAETWEAARTTAEHLLRVQYGVPTPFLGEGERKKSNLIFHQSATYKIFAQSILATLKPEDLGGQSSCFLFHSRSSQVWFGPPLAPFVCSSTAICWMGLLKDDWHGEVVRSAHMIEQPNARSLLTPAVFQVTAHKND